MFNKSLILFTTNTGIFFQALGFVYIFYHPDGRLPAIFPLPWIDLIILGFYILVLAILFEIAELVSSKLKSQQTRKLLKSGSNEGNNLDHWHGTILKKRETLLGEYSWKWSVSRPVPKRLYRWVFYQGFHCIDGAT